MIILLDKTLIFSWDHVEPFEAVLKLQFGPDGHHLRQLYGEKSWYVFLKKT